MSAWLSSAKGITVWQQAAPVTVTGVRQLPSSKGKEIRRS